MVNVNKYNHLPMIFVPPPSQRKISLKMMKSENENNKTNLKKLCDKNHKLEIYENKNMVLSIAIQEKV